MICWEAILLGTPALAGTPAAGRDMSWWRAPWERGSTPPSRSGGGERGALGSGRQGAATLRQGTRYRVIPKGDYLPGERVKVTVRFADGAAPASASFWLVGHAAKGTRRVYVFRQPRPPDVCEKERDEAQAEARQCKEYKARLLAERQEPGGLMGAAWLERAGVVAVKDLDTRLRERLANALGLTAVKSYSYTPTGGV
jgi:hypothetical protein